MKICTYLPHWYNYIYFLLFIGLQDVVVGTLLLLVPAGIAVVLLTKIYGLCAADLWHILRIEDIKTITAKN